MLTTSSKKIEKILYISLFLLGMIYVFNSWSPSSYGFFLKKIDSHNTGIVWGEPRGIRSDEWAVVTPLTQATINNSFERYNKTSFYGEDLRINYGLPIFDWGMIFKPTMWGYLLLPPAKAYSLQWYITFCIFIIGYFTIFKEIGIEKKLSLFLSFSLFFTGGTQFWWDEKGPVYAFFPWVVYFLISKKNFYLRMVLFYWVGTSWLLTNFYPPLVISLAFIGGLLFISDLKSWRSIKHIIILAFSSVAIVLTSLLYLKDYLIKTSNTVYPGHRAFSGGSVNWGEWLSQFFPFSTFNSHFETIYNNNICEVGVTGFSFVLLLLIHLDYTSVKKSSFDEVAFKRIKALAVGVILCNLWLIAPVPSWAGSILLWNNVSPNRMVYAAGILLAMVSMLFFQNLKFKISLTRFVLYTALIIIVWYLMKYRPLTTDLKNFGGFDHNYTDFYLIIALVVSYAAIKYFSCKPIEAFVIPSLLASLLVFFNFNPIQSTDAIFSPHLNAKKILDSAVDKQTGVLALEGYHGSTLNGLGYKSVSHVTAVPDLTLWRKKFPEMQQDKFDKIFNRYSHIRLARVDEPFSPQPDVVVVPISLFKKIEYYPNDSNEGLKVVKINNDEDLTGSLVSRVYGKMTSFSVLVGTYNGLSDGDLSLKICVEGVCETGNVVLKESLDNQYAEVQLNSPMLVKKGDLIEYSYLLRNASQPVAIYAINSTDELKMPTRKKDFLIGLGAKIRINYAGEK
ncbi:DUF7657 domain-containing protein [Pantoea anthophila]|uniref:DUF7657 domain-containing protein n=1 Tax=Pantoea anthophila TaxID=470931 RepID=UPI002DBA2D3B|nr:hypothetical protein [Pantoea anthophila]MEB5705525.1 hypothetical protein [Pantoea anthophila]MEB6516395.1 hypothetical protein [Pantoea anthophila]